MSDTITCSRSGGNPAAPSSHPGRAHENHPAAASCGETHAMGPAIF
ncbi:MAG: hypothetical protein ACKO2G_05555 [Verrucomicrobiales bacterium]